MIIEMKKIPYLISRVLILSNTANYEDKYFFWPPTCNLCRFCMGDLLQFYFFCKIMLGINDIFNSIASWITYFYHTWSYRQKEPEIPVY